MEYLWQEIPAHSLYKCSPHQGILSDPHDDKTPSTVKLGIIGLRFRHLTFGQAHSFSAVCSTEGSLQDRASVLWNEGLWNALLQIVDAALPIEIGSRYLRHNVRPIVRPR